MGLCGSKDKDPRLRGARRATYELAQEKPLVVQASMSHRANDIIEPDDIVLRRENEIKEQHKIYNSGILRWSREDAINYDQNPNALALAADEDSIRFVNRLQITDPQGFGDFQVNGMTIGSAYLESNHLVALNDMESNRQILYDTKAKVVKEVRRLKHSSNIVLMSEIVHSFKYHDLQITFYQKSSTGKVHISRGDTSIGDLAETFKLYYKGKQTSNSDWINYGRCAEVYMHYLIYISEKDELVFHDLRRLEDMKTSAGNDVQGATKIVLAKVQSFCCMNLSDIVLVTHDGNILRYSAKQDTGKLEKLKDEHIGNQSIATTLTTDVACDNESIVTVGYKEATCSNVYVLFTSDLKYMDTIEILNIDKSRPNADLHVHKLRLFKRNDITHLISINAACSINLLVAMAERLHPVKVAYTITSTALNGLCMLSDYSFIVYGVNKFVKLFYIF